MNEANDSSATRLMASGSETDFTIGSSSDNDYKFSGLIDEFRVYDITLTATEIIRNYE